MAWHVAHMKSKGGKELGREMMKMKGKNKKARGKHCAIVFCVCTSSCGQCRQQTGLGRLHDKMTVQLLLVSGRKQR